MRFCFVLLAPVGGILTYVSCMDTAYVRETTALKQPYKVQDLHLRYLKWLVNIGYLHSKAFMMIVGLFAAAMRLLSH